MTKSQRPDSFPATLGDVTVRDINLDSEEFIGGGERLTATRAAEIADRLERHRGRPSLTAPGAHSPVLNLRVSQDTKDQLEQLAETSGRRQSEIVREALNEYLNRHGQPWAS